MRKIKIKKIKLMKKLLAVLVLGVSMISCSTPDAPTEVKPEVVLPPLPQKEIISHNEWGNRPINDGDMFDETFTQKRNYINKLNSTTIIYEWWSYNISNYTSVDKYRLISINGKDRTYSNGDYFLERNYNTHNSYTMTYRKYKITNYFYKPDNTIDSIVIKKIQVQRKENFNGQISYSEEKNF